MILTIRCLRKSSKISRDDEILARHPHLSSVQRCSTLAMSLSAADGSVGTSPLLRIRWVAEFTRSNVRSRKYGRIYWSKYFSATEGLSYDVDGLSQWFDLIVDWVRKNAAGKLKESWTTYFLPDAWDKHLRQ